MGTKALNKVPKKNPPTTTRPSIPAHKQIQVAIEGRIRSGELRPGDLIDSERYLAKIHGVSPMTARQALRELSLSGLVVRRPSVGTFVAPPVIHFNKLMAFSEQMATRGLIISSKVLAATRTQQDEVASRLGLPCGSCLIKIERVRLGNSDPFALEAVYFGEKGFSALLDESLDRRSLFDLLENKYQLKIAYADEEIDVTILDTRTAGLLKAPQGSPTLRVRQVLYCADARPISYSLGLYRADRHSLLVRRFR